MAKHIEIGKPVNEAERWAFEYLSENLPASYLLITNLEVLAQSGQPLEVDALVMGELAIYVVDVKGYLGKLEVGVNSWELNGSWVDNSLAKANYVAKVLASRIKRRLPQGVHAPWCQGAVLATGNEGYHIDIHKSENELCVFSPDDIVEALSSEKYITSRYKHPISEQQKDFALEVIGKIGVMGSRNNNVQDFVKGKMLGKVNGMEVWEARYQLGDWSADWLLKLVQTSSAENPEDYTKKTTLLKQEFYRLQQLSGVSGVPVTAPVINDGEQLVLPIKRPRGVPLEKLDVSSFEKDRILQLLRRAVVSLQQIHQRGCTLGSIGESSVFASEDGDLEFLEVRNNLTDVEDIGNFRELFCGLARQSGSEVVVRWFESKEEVSDLEQIRLRLNSVLAGTAAELDDEELEIEEGAVIAGKYSLSCLLSESANVQHWKATHIPGQFQCVLSVYSNAEELWQEASAQYSCLMQMYHPAIERVFDLDVIRTADVYYISRAWVQGEILASVATSATSYSVKQWFRTLLIALQYMHQQGLTHKNITPNTIICSGDAAVLVNFSGLPQELLVADNLRYTDPSIQDTGWTPESDVYALILSFAESIAGATPGAVTPEELVADIFPKFLDENSSAAAVDFINRRPVLDGSRSYLEIFGLHEPEERIGELPEEFSMKWGISKGYMRFMVLDMLNDQRSRSRNQWVLNALRSRHISGNKTNRGSMSATISRLKSEGIAEDYGKKVRLTRKFTDSWADISNGDNC